MYKPRRERLPDTRQSITHKFNISGHEGYLNVGLYPDGRPGELFITMAKEGSTVGGLMDSFGTAISLSLQYGVPLEVLVNKFSHTRFEPMGHTTNPDIRIAKSMVDYIFRWMGINFIAGYREAMTGMLKSESTPAAAPAATGSASGSAPATATPEATAADASAGSAKATSEESKPTSATATSTASAPAKTAAKPMATRGSSLSGKLGQASADAKTVAEPAKAKATATATATKTAAKRADAKEAAPSEEAITTAARFNRSQMVVDSETLERAGAIFNESGLSGNNRNAQFARFQSDAPTCDNCGSIFANTLQLTCTITQRNSIHSAH